MASERAAFLTQMVEVLTSTVSFGERLNNMVHLLARNLKVDLALYFGLDKARETLLLNVSSQGPVPPHLRLEFPLGQGLVGETARHPQVYRGPPPAAGSGRPPMPPWKNCTRPIRPWPPFRWPTTIFFTGS